METGGPMRRKIVIVGEKGAIEINPTEYPKQGYGEDIFVDMYVTLESECKAWNCRPDPQTFGPYDRYQEMFKEFAKIVNGEMQNPYSYEYEKLVHDVLLQACGVNE